MQAVEQWLCARNLPQSPPDTGAMLEGEALHYAVATFLRRPRDVPDEVVISLAEGLFVKVCHPIAD